MGKRWHYRSHPPVWLDSVSCCMRNLQSKFLFYCNAGPSCFERLQTVIWCDSIAKVRRPSTAIQLPYEQLDWHIYHPMRKIMVDSQTSSVLMLNKRHFTAMDLRFGLTNLTVELSSFAAYPTLVIRKPQWWMSFHGELAFRVSNFCWGLVFSIDCAESTAYTRLQALPLCVRFLDRPCSARLLESSGAKLPMPQTSLHFIAKSIIHNLEIQAWQVTNTLVEILAWKTTLFQ